MSNDNNTNQQPPDTNEEVEYEFADENSKDDLDSKKQRLLGKQRMPSVSDNFSINEEKNKQQQLIESY